VKRIVFGELERNEEEAVMVYFKVLPGVHQKRLSKATKRNLH
jgi:hypothetical protein